MTTFVKSSLVTANEQIHRENQAFLVFSRAVDVKLKAAVSGKSVNSQVTFGTYFE